MSAVPAGWRLFARYAYAPNARGYCGPPEAAALEAVARGGGEDVDVPALAKRFSGAWPYQQLIAELAGIDDPLDEAVGRAYWTGNELTDRIDARQLGELLIERFAHQAGHYWSHLNESLLEEITPTHVFHVLAVYPWSRLLATGRPEPLEVLDSCRITAAEVTKVEVDHLMVQARRLAYDGKALSFAPPSEFSVTYWSNPGADLAPGTHVAVHWGHVCEPLTDVESEKLATLTERQLELTNCRLAG